MEKRRINKNLILSIALIILLSLNVFSLEVKTSAVYNYGDNLFSLYNSNTPKTYFEFISNLTYLSENIHFNADISFLNNKAYNDPFSESYYGGFYFYINDGSISLNLGNSKISFGKTHLGDMVKSPYSLFVSSVNYPRNTLEYRYEDDKFIYVTRWIELNNLINLINSSNLQEKYRSANYKVYAVKFPNIRFGYEEVNVYIGKNFDFEYFANPIPGFFIQYVNSAGRPYPEGLGESNFIMGFFGDYSDKEKYLYTQILIDDINMNRFLHPDSYQNPDKIAWSFGGSFSTNVGKIEIHHAGATKYTFQPSSESGNQMYYGYTYFPYFTYNGTNTIFPLEMLYAGYKYGENNLAFLINYSPNFVSNLKTSLEYVILGERSPVNPWNDLTTFKEGTHLLDDPVLEHRLVGNANYSFKILDGLNIWLNTSLGYIWNKSELTEVTTDNVKKPLMRPVSGNNIPFFSLVVGLNFEFNF